MQINGVGSGQVRDSYQKPNQAANTTANKKETDEANKRLEALGVKVELSSQQRPVRESKPVQAQETPKPQEEKFSLFEILKTLWEEGKKLLKALWYSEGEEAARGSDTGEQNAESADIKVREISSEIQGPEIPDGSVRVIVPGADEEPGVEATQMEVGDAVYAESTEAVMEQAQSAEASEPTEALDPAEVAAAAMAVTPPAEIKNGENPAAAESAGRQQETLWEKIRTRIREIAGQLMGNIWGESTGFETQSSLQSDKEQTQEEPAKKNEFEVELPELEGKPLHTSHLQDSYNKYGQYSKLAQDPQSSMSIRK